MAGWRDGASEQAQADLDGLLDFALGFATSALDRRGEMYPFGVVMKRGEEIAEVVMGFPPGVSEIPPSEEVIAVLVGGLKEQLDELAAIAIVTDVLADGHDAVHVALEHADGIAIAVLLPYESKRLGRKKRYGELIGQESEARFWV